MTSEPFVKITVTIDDGKRVRTIEIPRAAGVTMELTYPDPEAAWEFRNDGRPIAYSQGPPVFALLTGRLGAVDERGPIISTIVTTTTPPGD